MVTLFQFGLIVFTGLGSLTYGYCSSIIATTLGQPSFIAYFDLATRSNANSLIGAINGLYQSGGLFGAVSVLFIPDKVGRRWALFIGGVCCIVGGALQAGSVHIAMFLIARFLVGYGIGSLVTLVPLYQSEVSPTSIRGFLVGMGGVMICIGYITASWVGLGFYFVPGHKQWRGPLAIQVLPPLLLCLGLNWVPESPRWLLLRDQSERARAQFRRIHADVAKSLGEHVLEEEFLLLRAQVAQEIKHHVPLKQFWTQRSLRKRCIIGWLTYAAGQGTGTLVINNYGPLLYSNLGFNTVQQLLIQCGWITVAPFVGTINSLIVDRVGRVRLLMFGLAGTLVALVGECITLSIFQRTGNRGVAGGAVFFLFLHVFLFGGSYDSTSYIYGSEIFPNPVRARGLGISITGLFASTIVFLQCAPTAFASIGWKYYLLFIALDAVMFVVMWLYFPETKGISLEDIGEVFGDDIVLEDPSVEAVHRRFKESHYREEALVNLEGDEEKRAEFGEVERSTIAVKE
ncbi:uncharacterized protein Z520_07193 [Fonsecaea multimorphosa CBS 102226]|uniref:Major facilitator superfamily (MFS) profile domain-containing protein n=1 Tax=Fonsecaea multimorphosa CBS 102226 TaxID=1442371 RepID=A0A0D2K214_9EURO|nr:uncharacterized protein Z520_07193 [Fonsecaea multimorphosa CBS 102226]KIX97079.1 hypothetical protein Z520_07193 [Fonsecaea multimorphosa CBS 102226]